MRQHVESILFAAMVAVVLALPAAAQPVIVTVAGTDLVFQGNGQAAIAAPLGEVSRVGVDPTGQPVFADPNYHLVFQVDTNGVIHVLAGNNIQGMATSSGTKVTASGGGFSGDNGPATSAALNRPLGVAYDSNGNLYIADTGNNRIRMVNAQGTITTFAGSGQITSTGNTNIAGEAALSGPRDVAVDPSGNLYINDHDHGLIRKVTPLGIISTVASSCAGNQLADVNGVAVDQQGRVYFALTSANLVCVISPSGVNTVSTAPYNLNQPCGVAVDAGGDVLIADTANQRILEAAAGGPVSILAGNSQEGFSGDGGPATAASLHNPFGLAISPAGPIYIADRDNWRIRQINTQNAISTIAGNGTLISSQNGVSAPLATFLDPYGVAIDTHSSPASILVADTGNNLLQRVSSSGTVATVAGTGAGEYSGDGGPAIKAGLANPWSVISDPTTGNLFETDAGSGRLREINGTNGVISTIQANLGFPMQVIEDPSGNRYIANFGSGLINMLTSGGTFETLGQQFINPTGLALDAAGNLYIAEWGARRIWRFSPSGAGVVVAGGGTAAGAAADGGPATNALLQNPAGLVVDRTGNLYFTDSQANLVRKVDTKGILTTIAGTADQPGFAGDNGPASMSLLNNPWSLALDPSGNLYVADEGNNRIREILLNNASAPSFTVSTASLSIPAATDGPVSAGYLVSNPVTFGVTSTLPGLLFGVTADQPWLQTTVSSGAMPAQVQVTADPTTLTAGVYTAHITVTAAGAVPATQTVTVTFTVSAALPAALGADTTSLNFAFDTGAPPESQPINVRNLGSGSISYSVTTCGAAWLTVTPASGAATPNSPVALTVSADPSQAGPGTQVCNLTISGGANTTALPAIPVSISVAGTAAKLLLTQTGLTFPAVAGGGAPVPRSFGISNSGQGQMTWAATASTYPGCGSGWLTINPSSGTVVNPVTDVAQVAVSVVPPSSVAANTVCFGSIAVNVPGNPVQSVTVVVNVAASMASAADIYPGGLVFTGQAGVNPSSQTISIANLTAAPITYSSSRLGSASGTPQWYTFVPGNGTVAPNQPVNLVVQPDFSSLNPGVYQGNIALQFSDGSTGSVGVLAVVTTPPTLPGGVISDALPEASGCTPNEVTVQWSGGPQPLPVTKGQPVQIQVTATDNCGPISSSASVGVSFPANTDPGLGLTGSSPPGTWVGTWTPKNIPSSGNFQFTVLASETPSASKATIINQATVSFSITPLINPAAQQPIILPGAVQSAATAGLPLAPCSLVTIYGEALADGVQVNPPGTLTTSLAGAQVFLSGNPLYLLYAGPSGNSATLTQINAQVPCDLASYIIDNKNQITVQRDSVPSSGSDALPVATAAPAIFTPDATGVGQGSIYDANGNLVDGGNPAQAGDVVSIYCTGLGAVNPAVATGQPAPGPPGLANVTTPLTVTIGGVNATVNAAYMEPGTSGAYEVDVVVPSGVTPGGQVPVQIFMLTLPSQQVTMGVR